MVTIFLRTLIIYITLTVVIRLMGKRQIGEMQPFEFIVTLIIADLACVPMSDVSIPLIYGVVSIIALFVLHQIFSLLEQSGILFKRILSGKPSVVITKSGVNVKELKKNNMGVDDLIESMRSQGYFALDDLDYAIFESNGKLSALEKTDKQPCPTSIPLLLISEGKLDKTNAKIAGISESRIKEFLHNQDSAIKSTDVMTVDGNGRIYFQAKKSSYKILSIEMTEGVKW